MVSPESGPEYPEWVVHDNLRTDPRDPQVLTYDLRPASDVREPDLRARPCCWDPRLFGAVAASVAVVVVLPVQSLQDRN